MSNRGYSRFRNLNIVGCLRKKRLTKGGHGHPRTTPPLATPLTLMRGQNTAWLYVCTKKYSKSQELTEKDKPNDR